MDPQTEQLLRRDIRARWSPIFALLFIFLGVACGLGLIGLLSFVIRAFGGQ